MVVNGTLWTNINNQVSLINEMASLSVENCAPTEWASVPVWESLAAKVAADVQEGYTPSTGEIIFLRDTLKIAIYNGEFWSA